MLFVDAFVVCGMWFAACLIVVCCLLSWFVYGLLSDGCYVLFVACYFVVCTLFVVVCPLY